MSSSPSARFDLADPAFDVTSPVVHEAREESWYVETNWGWAVLRHAEVSALLRDRRFRQGNARWPAQNGICRGSRPRSTGCAATSTRWSPTDRPKFAKICRATTW